MKDDAFVRRLAMKAGVRPEVFPSTERIDEEEEEEKAEEEDRASVWFIFIFNVFQQSFPRNTDNGFYTQPTFLVTISVRS